jgi:hypothetical protein
MHMGCLSRTEIESVGFESNSMVQINDHGDKPMNFAKATGGVLTNFKTK